MIVLYCYFASYIIALILHLCIFKGSSKNKIYQSLISLIYYIFSFFTPDLVWASHFKNKYYARNNTLSNENPTDVRCIDKVKYTNHIKTANFCNLVISVLILLSLLSCSIFSNKSCLAYKYTNIFIFLIIFRIISRSLEILISFGKDVLIEKESIKKSNLTKYERLGLAFKSLVELIFLNTTFYALINNQICLLQIGNSFLFSTSVGLVFGVVMKGYGDNITFNFSNQFSYFNAMVILQAVTSFVLIVLAIAKYLSDEKEQNHHEIIDCLPNVNFSRNSNYSLTIIENSENKKNCRKPCNFFICFFLSVIGYIIAYLFMIKIKNIRKYWR